MVVFAYYCFHWGFFIICILDRFVPLFKALRNQKAKKHKTFLSRQRLYSETQVVTEKEIQKLKNNLVKQRYNVRDENGYILAEKGRFSRWGPYVNHIGLIIILLAAILRATPLFYMEEYVWVREEQNPIVIPGTSGEFYIENKDFILETHSKDDERFKDAIAQEGMIPSNFQTDVVIYQAGGKFVPGEEAKLEPILTDSIRMNDPAKFDKYTIYQSGYQLNEFSSMTFRIHETTDTEEKAIDLFTINLEEPEQEYNLDSGFRVVVDKYYPDYYLDDSGIPASETNFPRNPAYVFLVYPPIVTSRK